VSPRQRTVSIDPVSAAPPSLQGYTRSSVPHRESTATCPHSPAVQNEWLIANNQMSFIKHAHYEHHKHVNAGTKVVSKTDHGSR
jgi:hypothetical protein